jgi:intracellular sulfur oxidation DsrE/DsrF family protein
MKVKLLFVALAALLFVAGPSFAQNDDKPFAEAFIVLQISDRDEEVQARVISVANNLIKHYGGPDFVDIEIVAFGPGLSLLYPDNPQRERIESLVAADVRFVGCMNTVATIERKTGKKLELIPETIPVQTGVAHLVERATQGYVVIRP